MISEYLGFDSDYIILGLAGVVIILLILIITNMVQIGKLKKRYKVFMSGKTAKSLEDTIIKRLDEVDELVAANSSIKKNISNQKYTLHIYMIVSCKCKLFPLRSSVLCRINFYL